MPKFEVDYKLKRALDPSRRIESTLRRLPDVILNHTANYRTSLQEVKQVLTEQMKRAKFEYIDKAASRDTKEGIQMAIDLYNVNNPPKRFLTNAAPITDFELNILPKMTEFTDHQGYYISDTGHKIDDYNVKLTQSSKQVKEDFKNQ